MVRSSMASGVSSTLCMHVRSNSPHALCRNPSIILWRVCHDDGTSNLNCHCGRCSPATGPEALVMAAYASGSKYKPARHRAKCVLWVTRRH